MAFRAELSYTRRDMRQYDKAYKMLRNRFLTQAMNVLLTALVFIVTGGIVLLLVLDRLDGELAKYALIFFALIVLWVALNEFRFFETSRALNRQGPAVLSVDDGGVRVVMGGVRSEYEFDAFTDIARDRDAYYLYISKASAVMIPERCFTVGDPAAFGAYIEQKTGLKLKEIK